MDVNSDKIKIVQWVLSLRDAHLVSLLADFTAPEQEIWEELSPQDRTALKVSLAQADAGELIPHSEAMKRKKKWH
jgi:predicted transcriptional regulator